MQEVEDRLLKKRSIFLKKGYRKGASDTKSGKDSNVADKKSRKERHKKKIDNKTIIEVPVSSIQNLDDTTKTAPQHNVIYCFTIFLHIGTMKIYQMC